MLTLFAALWERSDPDLAQPLCRAAHVDVTTTNGEEIYWRGAELALDDWSAKRYDAIVKVDRVVYVATPLLRVTDLEAPETRVVRPTMGALLP